MKRRSFLSLFALLLACLLALPSLAQEEHRGRKYVPPPETAKITVTVVRQSNGKPVHSAAVVMNPMKGGKDNGSMELKTDDDGKAVIDVIPVGDTIRLQIIADGFQTFGNDYVIDTAAKAITVKLKRPVEQYSIYKGNAPGDQSGQATESKPQ